MSDAREALVEVEAIASELEAHANIATRTGQRESLHELAERVRRLAALSDPEALAGIAGVLRDTYAHTACGGDPTTAGEVSDWLPEAAAVVEWLRGQG